MKDLKKAKANIMLGAGTLLFAVGYFLGSVENKREFMKNAANRLIPDKEVKVIDLKSELKREQELNQAADDSGVNAQAETKE